MATQGSDPLVGTTLGSFRVTKVIGKGGMGTVYLGEHAFIGSRVAIKVLQERLASDEGLVSRFYAEARAVNLIGHENIVNIFDMNVVPPNRYYLVMEYLEGKPLNYLLTAPVPAEVSVPILTQVCDALQAAHQAGIIHRDLKPENIFLIKRGKTENFVKVLDFGLAKLLDTSLPTGHTAAGLIVGTPEFLSPEQANSAPVDGRSDVYSLGCIAWLLATARLPFPMRGLTDLLVAHRTQLPRPPHEVVPTVPRALSDVIMRAMAKRPEDRFQSAQAFGEALDAALKGAATPKPSAARVAPTIAPVSMTPVGGIPAQQPQPRHAARFDAQVSALDGKSYGTMQCTDISKGGMFLSTSGAVPAVFSRVKIVIPSAGNLSLLAEVVRHVPADQARAWNMPPGFGVQFFDLTPALREDIGRLTQGLPVQPRMTPSSANLLSAESVITMYRERMLGDHYAVLGLPPSASMDEVRTHAARDEAKLLELSARTLDAQQAAQLGAALARVRDAGQQLGNATTRALYDAHRGNWQGIAQCLLGGLGPLDLERVRQEYLAGHPTAAGSAHVKFLASKGFEQQGRLREAVAACESALRIDPLNLQLHQRHAALTKRLQESPAT
jgi:serine/threonine-protein kinase